MKDILRFAVHDGSHHADDATGAAILRFSFPHAVCVRSREPSVWATCDALVDVGGEYDPARGRFDHHQKGFSERRPSGVPYAGAGLVWKTYGPLYVARACPELGPEAARAVADAVDAQLISHIDAVDSGVAVPGPAAFSLSGIIDTLNPTWETECSADLLNERFDLAVAIAGLALNGLVKAVAAEHNAAGLVRAATRLFDGRVLVLDKARLPFEPVVCAELLDVLFVVYPDSGGEQYQVRVVPRVLGTFEARADLPAEWAGLRDGALAAVTGVTDSVFCHNGRFICGAGSREGAIALAELAVKAVTRRALGQRARVCGHLAEECRRQLAERQCY